MNRQWKGIVFMDFREEKAPHFILSLIEELHRENIAESIAPCQTFAKSFMMVSPATKRKDLVLLLREFNEEQMNRLETWRNNQGEQVVMILSEYVKQYASEFTGIGQPSTTSDSDRETDQKGDGLPRKPKKGRRKRNRPSEEVEDNTENKPESETSAIDGGIDSPSGITEDQ
jgi:hypothetical protein